MIRLLKGYARKSVVFEELYRGCPAQPDQKLILDLVGRVVFIDSSNVYTISNISNVEKMETVLEDIHNLFPECVSLFVYGNFTDEWVKPLLEISERYTRYFDILYTIQSDKSTVGSFEIIEYRYAVAS